VNAPPAPPLPNIRIPGFEIERLLGHGSMGAVYLARTASGCAALKLLDLGGADGPAMARTFEREVALCRRLAHPGIVRILEAGRQGDLAFIAMDHVAGGDLGRYRANARPLPAATAVDIATRVAHALAHAHTAGITHRDIKPANILVDAPVGVVKLADFGLARLASLQRSRTGILAGTPAYMSPEQLADGAMDARADLYSLGVVLFEMLAGRLPFEATSLGALMREVGRTPAPNLQRLRPELPGALSQLVAKLLQKDRSQRPASASILANDLETVGRTLLAAADTTTIASKS
jgi:serine/threonine-protein kinase